MYILEKVDLLDIVGGISINGTMINSLVRGINSILELGRSLGTVIRRVTGNTIC